MARADIRIGLSADLFGTHGQPMFGDGPLEMFRDAGLAWSIMPPGGALEPAAVAEFDALFLGGMRVTEGSFAGDPGRLRIIARNGVGYDAMDTEALTRRGILLTNTPVAVRNPVATTALAFILALSLRLPLKTRILREGKWSQRTDFPGVGLPGRTLGIVGLGGIGRELVRLAEPFGMRIVASDPHLKQQQVAGLGVELLALEALLAQSDFMVVACLLNDATRKLINAERLALMKPTAFLINVARGPIVDETALTAALAQGAIAGAGLDVFEREPPDPANPLFTMENVIATPHSLCWTDRFLDDVARSAVRSIIDTIEGRLPEHIVNPEAIRHPRVTRWLAEAAAN